MYINPEANKEKQRIVLSKMLELGMISKEEYDQAVSEELHFARDPHFGNSIYSYFVDTVIAEVLPVLEKSYGSSAIAQRMLYTGGLQICCTIDPAIQALLEATYTDESRLMYQGDTLLQSAMAVLENSTGEIKGIVGGMGEKSGSLTLNRALTVRQPGSTIKPIAVYAPALEYGVINAATLLQDVPTTFTLSGGGTWSPRNSGGSFQGDVNGYCDNMANVAALLAAGSKAVREACPDAKVVIHLTLSTAITTDSYKWFFDEMQKNSLDYDVIGASYYPFWTNQKPTMLTSLANTMYNRYGKPTLIMETGYSWTRYRPSGRYGGNYEGQLHLNGSVYNEATEAGQKAFMHELQSVIRNNTHILGYLYWDPVMVEQKVNGSWIKTGWVQDGENQVGNTTWFDYSGKALPVFEAIKEAANNDPTGISEKVIVKGEEFATAPVYNLAGQRVANMQKGRIYIVSGKKIVMN